MKSRGWILLVMSLFLAYPLFADEDPIDMDEEPDPSYWGERERFIDYRPLLYILIWYQLLVGKKLLYR